MVTRRKACYMSKVLEYCRQKGPNLHSKSFKYFLPNLHKSSLPLKLGICLHSHVPEFIELKNSVAINPDLNSVNYSVWGALQQIASSQNFSNWPAKTCANRMLGWADSSDQSAALKDWWRLWMQKLGNCLCRISSKLNVCVNDCWYFSVCWMTVNLNSCVTAIVAWF